MLYDLHFSGVSLVAMVAATDGRHTLFQCGQDVKWLQTITTMPVLVKGVMTAEDSELLTFLLMLHGKIGSSFWY